MALTLISVIIIIAEHPQASIICPKSVRRELTANETRTSGTTTLRVPAAKASRVPVTTLGDDRASALLWKVSPPLLRPPSSEAVAVDQINGIDYGQANDAVQLQVGKYTFTYSSSSRSSGRKSTCQFTVEILGNVAHSDSINLLFYPWDQVDE